jgi:membrane protein DedA with SNARE-associated domain
VTLQYLIETYGYYAVLVGSLLEGETILVMAGFAAHRGLLALPWVIVAAFAGGLCGDQIYFWLGRWHGQRVLRQFPDLGARAGRVDALLVRYGTFLILVIRFLYGLRTVGPIVIGMSSVPAAKFAALNAVGAAAWAVAIAGAGYLFGNALELVISDLKRYEEMALGLIAVAGVVIWLLRRRRGG